EELFGILSLIDLRLDGYYSVAVLIGTTALMVRLRAFRSLRIWSICTAVLAGALALAYWRVPSRHGYWWCLTFAIWLLPLRLARLHIPIRWTPIYSTGWIYRIHQRGPMITSI